MFQQYAVLNFIIKMYMPMLYDILSQLYQTPWKTQIVVDIRISRFLSQTCLGSFDDMWNWLQDAFVIESA